MARAIDGDLLAEYIKKIDMSYEIKITVLCTVNTMPTVYPVKHGKWALPENAEIAITCICSECKNEFLIWAKKDYKYFPNCGARMDKECE